MAHPREFDISCKVYVGELGHGCPKHELEEKFSKYGTLKNVWVARRPAGFAFVEFDDPRDAEDAVRALDGVRINGRRAKVEMSSGRSRSRGGGGGGGRRGGSPGWGGRRGGSPRGGPRYDDYRSSRRSPSPRRGRSRSRSDSPAYSKRNGSRDRYRSGSRDRNRSASRSVSRSKY